MVSSSLLRRSGGSENVGRGRSSPKRATTMREIPMIAPQGQGPLGPISRSLFGIQPVRTTTRRGNAEILAIVARARINQESRNRIDGTRPMPLIVNETQDGQKVTGVHVYPLTVGGGAVPVEASTIRQRGTLETRQFTLRRKSRLNPFGINRHWKCGFHLHGWAAGPWELKTPRQVSVRDLPSLMRSSRSPLAGLA